MRIALIAHDKKKDKMIKLTTKFKEVLSKHELYAAQPHEPDVSALLRLCDVTNIPLATNISSAEIMLRALENEQIMRRKELVK